MEQPQKKLVTGGGTMMLPAIQANGKGSIVITDQLDEIKSIDAAGAKKRNKDWIKRLDHLMQTIEAWGQKYAPEYRIEKKRRLQINEEMLLRFKINPLNVPIVELLCNEQRIIFSPSSLWGIGANGQVNVVAPEHRVYRLADMGGVDGYSSEWKIFSEKQMGWLPFDHHAFQKIVRNKTL